MGEGTVICASNVVQMSRSNIMMALRFILLRLFTSSQKKSCWSYTFIRTSSSGIMGFFSPNPSFFSFNLRCFTAETVMR